MDPFALPANTEFAYAHLYQPHDFLFTKNAFMIPPINPKVAMNTNFTLAELTPQTTSQTTPESPPISNRGRRRKK